MMPHHDIAVRAKGEIVCSPHFLFHGITEAPTTIMFADLLLVCYLANATCAIINIMTNLIFIILIVSRLHAFFLVVAVRSSLHALR